MCKSAALVRSGRRTQPSAVTGLDEARAEVALLGIEPRLVLRPTTSSGESWDVLLEFPDLSHLLLRFPQTRTILRDSRCVVAGMSGRPLARGRLLHGSQRIRLGRWPKPGEVLLQFERSDPQLDLLLRTECLLRPDHTWLLRIASDGLAHECRRLRVRPGERYIVLNTVGPVEPDGHAMPIDVDCAGIHAGKLDLPKSLSSDWQVSIANLRLQQAQTIEVWPAGLAAVAWDGDGYGEWLASDRPCLAIRADHPLASLRVSMDTSSHRAVDLTSVEPGTPVFLELPQLPVGIHTLKFSAKSSLAGELEPLDDQAAVIRIREDRPHSSVVDPRGPLFVQIDPALPTLQQLWEGAVEVLIRGPPDREVRCHVSLFGGDGGAAILSKVLPPLNLPVASEAWDDHFDEYFRDKEDAQEAYDMSSVCTLDFDADDLGVFTYRFERASTPVRWALRRDGRSYVLRLFDDSGHRPPPILRRLAFETPDVQEEVVLSSEMRVPDPGGLYVARTGGHLDAIVVPARRRGYKREELLLSPKIEQWDRSLESTIKAVEITGLWGTGEAAWRSVGYISTAKSLVRTS